MVIAPKPMTVISNPVCPSERFSILLDLQACKGVPPG
jgi:hypothetical protein